METPRQAKACNDASTPNPEYSGVILACGGELAMEARRHGEAYTLFLAAFSHFENAGHASKLECVKRCAPDTAVSIVHPMVHPWRRLTCARACSDREIEGGNLESVHSG
eukprot:COSAG01_NODE_2658_length_7302_cov_4.298626_10_plen_109_part_00